MCKSQYFTNARLTDRALVGVEPMGQKLTNTHRLVILFSSRTLPPS